MHLQKDNPLPHDSLLKVDEFILRVLLWLERHQIEAKLTDVRLKLLEIGIFEQRHWERGEVEFGTRIRKLEKAGLIASHAVPHLVITAQPPFKALTLTDLGRTALSGLDALREALA